MEPNVPAIVGEAVAGQAAKVVNQIKAIIAGVNTSTFDLVPLMHEAKSQQYYLPLGFDTFGSFAKSLDLKVTKSYYLAKIGQVMEATDTPRDVYEPLGIAKLRSLIQIEPTEETIPLIQGLIVAASDQTAEEVAAAVDEVLGKTGDESEVWLNIKMTKAARDQVVLAAVALMKLHIGSVGVDQDGKAKDASDGRAIELICADWLSDPNNNPEPVQPVMEIVKDGEVVKPWHCGSTNYI